MLAQPITLPLLFCFESFSFSPPDLALLSPPPDFPLFFFNLPHCSFQFDFSTIPLFFVRLHFSYFPHPPIFVRPVVFFISPHPCHNSPVLKNVLFWCIFLPTFAAVFSIFFPWIRFSRPQRPGSPKHTAKFYIMTPISPFFCSTNYTSTLLLPLSSCLWNRPPPGYSPRPSPPSSSSICAWPCRTRPGPCLSQARYHFNVWFPIFSQCCLIRSLLVLSKYILSYSF